MFAESSCKDDMGNPELIPTRDLPAPLKHLSHFPAVVEIPF